MASAASPPPLIQKPAPPSRPSLCIKPSPGSTSPPSVNVTTQSSFLSKEWIIPPRPKPGRKPATDTPPTKRKAQNRAAQRAFRERRAARVGELEDQMKQVEEEHDREMDSLREMVQRLEKEAESYQTELNKWVERCRNLEKDLSQLRHASVSTDAVPLPRRTTTISNAVPEDSSDMPMGCGNCSLTTRCQCLDDAFNAMSDVSAQPEPTHHEKRPHSPSPPNVEKRIKAEPHEELEIDFTTLYASRPPAPAQASRTESVSPTSGTADRCGFCQDGTPCICAEMAAHSEQQREANTVQNGSNSFGPRAHQLSQFTPPPSEGDVSTAQPLPTKSCASGPGTCTQCRTDPNSTLFCKSLAASRSQFQSSIPSSGCCGGKTANGVCCQSTPTPAPGPSTRSLRSRPVAASSDPQQSQPHQPSVTLTCADAYTTLSRHPAYSRASGEIARWMPKLYASDARPTAAKNAVPGIEGRPAMEIDAANVMAVLKEFDRRFGES